MSSSAYILALLTLPPPVHTLFARERRKNLTGWGAEKTNTYFIKSQEIQGFKYLFHRASSEYLQIPPHKHIGAVYACPVLSIVDIWKWSRKIDRQIALFTTFHVNIRGLHTHYEMCITLYINPPCGTRYGYNHRYTLCGRAQQSFTNYSIINASPRHNTIFFNANVN